MTNDCIKVCINDKDLGKRIDIVLSNKIDSLSRSRVQRLLIDKKVMFNQEVICDQSFKLNQCGEIEINIPPIVKLNLKSQKIKLDIIFEDDDLIVVNKPAGMVVHPGAGNIEGTLVNALLSHCEGSLSGIGGYERPGIVHRIDKMTSGLVIIAKNDLTHKALSNQFKNREIIKIYEAFVWNKIKVKSQKIEGKICRSKVNRKKMTIDNDKGKTATTICEKLHEFIIDEKLIINHIQCQILTGRTHQIRVHLTSIGNSLLGDSIYGKKNINFLGKKVSSKLVNYLDNLQKDKRHALHAKYLKFCHPVTKNDIELSVQLPDDLDILLNELKKN